MGDLGLGAMLSILAGNKKSVEAWQSGLGKIITRLTMDDDANGGDGALYIEFGDDTAIELYDCARSCCESRYLVCDDDLGNFIGSALVDAEVNEAFTPDGDEDDYEVHEQSFLIVHTSGGDFTVSAHNRHNGYYGGIYISCRKVNKRED